MGPKIRHARVALLVCNTMYGVEINTISRDFVLVFSSLLSSKSREGSPRFEI